MPPTQLFLHIRTVPWTKVEIVDFHPQSVDNQPIATSRKALKRVNHCPGKIVLIAATV